MAHHHGKPCKPHESHDSTVLVFLKKILKAVLALKPAQAPGHFDFGVSVPQPKQKDSNMLTITIDSESKDRVSINPKTGKDKPVTLDPTSVPTWTKISTDDDGGTTIQVADDGLSATFVSGDNPGTASYRVDGDAAPGQDVETISDIVTVIVVSPHAKSLGLTADAPEPK